MGGGMMQKIRIHFYWTIVLVVVLALEIMLTGNARAANQAALDLLDTQGLLLVPDSTYDRVMAFHPETGDLVDADFIPADPTHLSTPLCAILGPGDDNLLVSDQIEDVIQQYDLLTGAYLGVFAPSGGPDTAILDNIRGIARSHNNTFLVTVGSGANADCIAEFDTSGNYLGNFIAIGAGGLDSPFDVLYTGTEYLVGGIDSDAIHRYNASGAPLANLASIDTFPEQLAIAENGNILVGNFSGSQEGVVEFTSAGALVGIYDPASLSGYRGVYELPNGNILTANGSGVHEIDRSGNLVETKISGVSAHYLEYIYADSQTQPLSIPTLNQWGMMFLFTLLMGTVIWTRRKNSTYQNR